MIYLMIMRVLGRAFHFNSFYASQCKLHSFEILPFRKCFSSETI